MSFNFKSKFRSNHEAKAEKNSLNKAVTENNYKQILEIAIRLGNFYYSHMKYSSVIELLKMPIDKLEKSKESLDFNHLYYILGSSYFVVNKKCEAEEILTKGLEVAKKFDNTAKVSLYTDLLKE